MKPAANSDLPRFFLNQCMHLLIAKQKTELNLERNEYRKMFLVVKVQTKLNLSLYSLY